MKHGSKRSQSNTLSVSDTDMKDAGLVRGSSTSDERVGPVYTLQDIRDSVQIFGDCRTGRLFAWCLAEIERLASANGGNINAERLTRLPVDDSSASNVRAEGPLNRLAAECHEANKHWWHHPATGERLGRNKGELLMLIVSEVSEAMEGERKGLMDDHLPHRRMAEVELADVLIRVFDYAGAFGYDLDGAVAEKRAYNSQREDHKAEARLRADGKKW